MPKTRDGGLPAYTIAQAMDARIVARKLPEPGAQAIVASEMGVSEANVSRWLHGAVVSPEFYDTVRAWIDVDWQAFGLLLIATSLESYYHRTRRRRPSAGFRDQP